MRISDWSSDVCSSDLPRLSPNVAGVRGRMGLCRTAGEPTPAAAAPPYADVTYADVTYAGVTGDPSSRIPFMPLRALRGSPTRTPGARTPHGTRRSLGCDDPLDLLRILRHRQPQHHED